MNKDNNVIRSHDLEFKMLCQILQQARFHHAGRQPSYTISSLSTINITSPAYVVLNELSKFYIQDFPPRAREVLNFWLVNKIFINFGVPCSLRVLFLLFIGWLNKSQPPPSPSITIQ